MLVLCSLDPSNSCGCKTSIKQGWKVFQSTSVSCTATKHMSSVLEFMKDWRQNQIPTPDTPYSWCRSQTVSHPSTNGLTSLKRWIVITLRHSSWKSRDRKKWFLKGRALLELALKNMSWKFTSYGIVVQKHSVVCLVHHKNMKMSASSFLLLLLYVTRVNIVHVFRFDHSQRTECNQIWSPARVSEQTCNGKGTHQWVYQRSFLWVGASFCMSKTVFCMLNSPFLPMVSGWAGGWVGGGKKFVRAVSQKS